MIDAEIREVLEKKIFSRLRYLQHALWWSRQTQRYQHEVKYTLWEHHAIRAAISGAESVPSDMSIAEAGMQRVRPVAGDGSCTNR
jgi:hypothetical protein